MNKLPQIRPPQNYDRLTYGPLYAAVHDLTALVNALIDAGGGGGTTVASGALLATVPGPAGRFEHEETLAAVGVTGSMKVLLSLAPHADTDENSEQALDLMGMAGEAGSGSITVRLAFGSLTSGPIRLNYMAV